MSKFKYDLVRNAPVTVIADSSTDDKGHEHSTATIVVDDNHVHKFEHSSRVSKALELMTPEVLANRLSGGDYFFVEGELIDFRDRQYKGFVHTDESIAHLAEHVGISKSGTGGKALRVHKNTLPSSFELGKPWSDHGITIPEYKEGGEFKSELHFGWNPFIKTINSAYLLWRLICSNGMEGLRAFMNTKIPLVNRWEEHLEIANRQIQQKIQGMVTRRLGQMGGERVTVAELLLFEKHISARLEEGISTLSNGSTSERDRLTNLETIISPMNHLSGVYKDKVFEDKRIAAQMPGHLSTFDLFNMVTEARSHTTENAKSTDRALDKLSNNLVFDRKDLTQHASRFVQPKLSEFSDPDNAFFGAMN